MNKKKIFLLTLACCLGQALWAVAADQSGYDRADGVNGGLLYDTFLKEGEVSARFSNSHGLDLAMLKERADFFRCKQCHGWDRIGTAGYYGGRAPKAGKRPHVAGVNLLESGRSLSPEQLLAKIKKPDTPRPVDHDLNGYVPQTSRQMADAMPAYGEIFNDQEIWDLVKFLKEDGGDYRNYYAMEITGSYPQATVRFVDIGKGGDRANGDRLYSRECASCHGPDGTAIDIGGKSAGAFAREKTYELAHKVRFGQPGSDMHGTPLSVREMNDLHRALTERATYPDLQK